ncbi:ATP-grasp domain-containing protein [Xenorhabdus bharatensis]|uniref:ATP-grasp domain-containing protein n=1 Tax=Xenorhabdus bharatensis TaxID=3136256 RepID=UPI0030F48733
MNKINVVVINPAPSRQYLYEKIKDNNINCYAVYTTPFLNVPKLTPVDNNLFDAIYYIEQDELSEVKNVLFSLKIDYVLCGSDASSYITDIIAENINSTYSNNSATSCFRSDKYLMQQKIKESSLNYIETIRINVQDDNIEDFNILWPRFCKPVNAAGSIGAFIATSNDEFKEKVNTQYSGYIIQEILVGRELFVDTFSVFGEHFISSVQQYKKTIKNNTPIPQYNEIVTDPILYQECIDYVTQCLDACGLKNGFSHTEVFLTQEGFKLIEINNRISGASGMPNKMATYVGLKSQPDLLSCFLKDGLSVLRGLPTVPRGYSRTISLHKYDDGILKDPTETLKKFKSVKEIHFLFQPGSRTFKSFFGDLTTVCFVLLFSNCADEIDRDTQAILELEADNSFLCVDIS